MSNHFLPNSTPTQNIYIDVLMPLLTSDEFKVLMYAIRRTFGFQSLMASISVDQFSCGKEGHDGGTGLNPNTVTSCLKSLHSFGILIRIPGSGRTPDSWELTLTGATIRMDALRDREAARRASHKARTARARLASCPTTRNLQPVGQDATPHPSVLCHNTLDPCETGRNTEALLIHGKQEESKPQSPSETLMKPPPPMPGLATAPPKGRLRDRYSVKYSDEVEDLWEAFYTTYPKRDGGNGAALARKKLNTLMKKKFDRESFLSSVRSYRRECDRKNKTGTEYVKQMSTWINERCWENTDSDEPAPTTNAPAAAYDFHRAGKLPPEIRYAAALANLQE